jgi:hypothetical protein
MRKVSAWPMKRGIGNLKSKLSDREYSILNKLDFGMTPFEVWKEDNSLTRRLGMGLQGNLVDLAGGVMSAPGVIGEHLKNNYGKYLSGLAATGLVAYAVNKYNKEKELENEVKQLIEEEAPFSGLNETSDEDKEFLRKLMYPTAAVIGTYGALKGYDKYKQYKAKRRLS